MSTGEQLSKALHRAEMRDKKRRPGMKVQGKQIFDLNRLATANSPKKRKH